MSDYSGPTFGELLNTSLEHPVQELPGTLWVMATPCCQVTRQNWELLLDAYNHSISDILDALLEEASVDCLKRFVGLSGSRSLGAKMFVQFEPLLLDDYEDSGQSLGLVPAAPNEGKRVKQC